MNYLLDTCVVSELVKPHPEAAVIEWMNSVPSEALFISVITIGEIKKGIVRLSESKKKMQLTFWFNTLLTDYIERIIPLDLSPLWFGNADIAFIDQWETILRILKQLKL